MSRKCQAKNPATCRTHGMGGPVERLEIDKAKAIREGDYKAQFEIQQKIDKYKDEAPEEAQEKAGFFGDLGWKLFKKIRLEKLDAKAEELGAVLNQRGVFGRSAAINPDILNFEMKDLKGMIQDHAVKGDNDYLELTYNASNVRLVIHTAVDDKGNAYIKNIEAYDHPWNNTDMDYDALNREVRAVFDLSTPEKKEQASGQPDVDMVPCGKCSVCDPAPSDMTHFGGWASRDCERPVPKQ